MASTAKFLTLCFILSTFVFGQPSLAERDEHDESVKDGLASYEAGDYREAARHFSEALIDEPADYNTHYFLANCYSKLGRYSDAKREYETCIQRGAPARVAGVCRDAIEKLTQAQKQHASATPGSKSIGEEEHVDSAARHGSRLVQAVEKQLKREEAAIEARRKKMEEEIAIRLSEIPKTVYQNPRLSRRGVILSRGKEVPNTVYEQEEKEMREEMEAKLAQMRRDFNRRAEALLRDAQARSHSLGEASLRLHGQDATQHSTVAVHEKSTNAYVRNYMNNGGPGEIIIEPLRAAPAKAAPFTSAEKSQQIRSLR